MHRLDPNVIAWEQASAAWAQVGWAEWAFWAAIAGVLINALVVATAFIVQRLQVTADRKLDLRREQDERAMILIALDQALNSIVQVARYMRRDTSDIQNPDDAVAVLDAELSVMDHCLARNPPGYDLLVLLTTWGIALRATKRELATMNSLVFWDVDVARARRLMFAEMVAKLAGYIKSVRDGTFRQNDNLETTAQELAFAGEVLAAEMAAQEAEV